MRSHDPCAGSGIPGIPKIPYPPAKSTWGSTSDPALRTPGIPEPAQGSRRRLSANHMVSHGSQGFQGWQVTIPEQAQ
eukprot:492301-Pyramimonas_sp.AAC.1